MSPLESSEHDSLYEELTSYLDGELDPHQVRQIEERLARDADYRAELQRMQRAWDLLDRLPRASVPESFSRSTMELVALAACDDARAVAEQLPQRQRRLRTGGLVAAAAAALFGFFVGRTLWSDPNEQLLQDLNVLQNYDLYYQADNLEFLKLLDQSGEFDDKDTDHAG